MILNLKNGSMEKHKRIGFRKLRPIPDRIPVTGCWWLKFDDNFRMSAPQFRICLQHILSPASVTSNNKVWFQAKPQQKEVPHERWVISESSTMWPVQPYTPIYLTAGLSFIQDQGSIYRSVGSFRGLGRFETVPSQKS